MYQPPRVGAGQHHRISTSDGTIPDTLQKEVDSTQLCIDNLGTLGADFDSNAYFAMKSRRDMKCMLQELAGVQSMDRRKE